MNRLKELRKEKHLTLRDLAKKININHVTLSRMENDLQCFNEDYIKIISDFFHVSTDYLLDISEIRNEKELKDNLNKIKDSGQYEVNTDLSDEELDANLEELHLQVTDIDLPGNDEKKIHSQLNSLKNELTKMTERKRKLQVKYIDDKITEEEYLVLLKEINDSIDIIENQIKENEDRIRSADKQRLNNHQIEEMIKIIEDLKGMWPNMTNTEKKMFITIHFKRIELDGESIKRIELQV
jgi:transcriptional regulator with XRE-family HTH domain